MTPSHGLPLLLALIGASACRGDRGAPAPAPSSEAPVAPDPPPVTTAPPACLHRRPFADSDKPLVLPAPFHVFSPCDLVSALLGHEQAAGEKVRVDHVRRWDVHGRTLLAALYYRGEDAEPKLLCDTCRVAVQLGIVERRGAALARAAEARDPWRPGPEEQGTFNGRASFDAEIPFDATETLLAVATPWTTVAAGTRTRLTLYRLAEHEAKVVFEQNVDWLVKGRGAGDDDEVVSAVTTAPRPDGVNDLVLKTTEVRCHYDEASFEPAPICGPRQPMGTERWRFAEAAYERVAGKAAPPPRVLRGR